ncbi:MAG: tRNA 2-thiouridine(34) synthase MnmA [Planctomycetia bacterium]|nr:tRNA 2-thiouridine(34) synthase MnmA [Planctomycetia bacterium]
MSKVVLAMSGGVDSSVAVELLRREGWEIVGVFMRHGIQLSEEVHRRKHGCCSEEDAADAQKVADRYGIPLHILDFHEEFTQIVEYFVDEYLHCRTPNPCIVCNAKLKFGKLFDFAKSIGAKKVATGHYARIRDGKIFRGVDATKDQSYVLHRIQPRYLNHLLFPVGEFHKTEIRQLAEEMGLHVAGKKDSQEICFVPNDDHAQFVRDYVFQKTGKYPSTTGHFVTTSGQDLGPHEGLERYTIGQRKGLRLAFREPHYVLRLDAETGEVLLGTHEELACQDLVATQANWLIPTPEKPFSCQIKIRYRTPAVQAEVTPLPGGCFQARLQSPLYGIAPGQAAVCYDGDHLLGGAWLCGKLPLPIV